jgi:DNA repair ATPase RecN
MSELREKIAKELLRWEFEEFIPSELKYAEIKCLEESYKILSLIREADDEADSKWVTVLKQSNFTVDSPESLTASISLLLEEARKEIIKGIRNIMQNSPDLGSLEKDMADYLTELEQSLKGKG